MQRISSHAVETRSCDIIKSKINAAFENGDSLYREFTGRDYGIDGVIELFENGCVTGMFALAQIKGTGEKIVPLVKTPEFISCSISSANALYAFQNRIPVILFLVSLKTPESIYFINVKQAIDESQRERIEAGQKSITIRIPVENVVIENMDEIFTIIRDAYN